MDLIDLFAGCGGLSCGGRLAGLKTVLAVEADKAAAESFALNHPAATVISSRIEEVDPRSVIASGTDLIICGGPPCQGFSSSNQRNRDTRNPQNNLYREMLRFSDELAPRVFVFENVFGITEGRKRDVLNDLVAQLKRRFRQVDYAILNAAEHGVPQTRRRVFVVATQFKSKITWPVRDANVISVGEALGDLPVLLNGACQDVLPYQRGPLGLYAAALRGDLKDCTGHTVSCNHDSIINRYRFIPQGGNWKHIPEDLMNSYKDKARCHTGIYRRLSDTSTSVVIGNFRKNMLIHPTQDRGLSVREAARLQSFPDHYKFSGSIGKRQQQVGNAVPPQLAAAVLQSLVDV